MTNNDNQALDPQALDPQALDPSVLRGALYNKNHDPATIKSLLTEYKTTPYQVNLIASKMCSVGDLNNLKTAAEKGIDLLFDNGDFVVEAAINGHIEVLKYLVENLGADVTVNNNAALRFASGRDNPEVLGYLLEKGADIHADNDCALYWAIKDGQYQNVEVLGMFGKFQDGHGHPLDVQNWTLNEKMLCHIMALMIDINVVDQTKNVVIDKELSQAANDSTISNSL
ncbi:hypothetical protein GCM10011607_12560 [Shewanella inventionis]|uniref:Ankyrin repeat domain-containing protein n=1 Tax=Shewanella inventionis TaxID=1738770 RepID=A0ABQ1IVX9_9GAMM|nr:ankyrin repeat domain-containing protein [Shewanella inventionis]GGB53485.1 hypothetical protein GCM10011607_12560 [Shewanella inventionis]